MNMKNLTKKLRIASLEVFFKFLNHKAVQQSLHDSIKLSKQKLSVIENEANPYFCIVNDNLNKQITSERDDIVIITSRFRSGSTLLWNIFRNIEDCTSYYEPLHERRWFDKSNRGEFIDPSHIGVDDYAREYDGLEYLSQYYDENWTKEGLYMDASTWAPDMKSYICGLIEKAKGRPILQFNRIDFRLPWLKHNFPNAKFIHLYRHPRDEWYSSLTKKNLMNKDNVENTFLDSFFLNNWCDDLAKHFPFLDQRNTPHPYQRFYYLWKLSYLYGKKECDQSFSMEALTQNPKQTLIELFSELNIDNKNLTVAASIIKKQSLDKWKQFADNEWFETLEQECEQNLNIFLTTLNRN